MLYSPLRYPGGKGKLAPFMGLMINKMNIQNGTYIEPFAGGAGVALMLLMEGYVDNIVINDYDKAIYSVWRAIVSEPENLVDRILHTPVDIEGWKKQKEIYVGQNSKYSLDLAFATFFLNRTNRSGILKGGPIGGFEQTGNYGIDARYNAEKLVERIRAIAKHKKHIKVYNKEIVSFIEHVLPSYGQNTLTYFDPPYFKKGPELYKNFFDKEDHAKIARLILSGVPGNWIITYDDTPEIIELYKQQCIRRYDLNYSAANTGKSSEVIVFNDDKFCPTNQELLNQEININLREVSE
ncbi:MAG: DNA adenine methylase [Lachnospiraceae bacterium]|nr:DNA adenine methylase [Lachnospiraceae bacterium]